MQYHLPFIYIKLLLLFFYTFCASPNNSTVETVYRAGSTCICMQTSKCRNKKAHPVRPDVPQFNFL